MVYLKVCQKENREVQRNEEKRISSIYCRFIDNGNEYSYYYE